MSRGEMGAIGGRNHSLCYGARRQGAPDPLEALFHHRVGVGVAVDLRVHDHPDRSREQPPLVSVLHQLVGSDEGHGDDRDLRQGKAASAASAQPIRFLIRAPETRKTRPKESPPHLLLGSHAEGALLELLHLAVAGASALGEEQQRAALFREVPADLERLELTLAAGADQGDVPCGSRRSIFRHSSGTARGHAGQGSGGVLLVPVPMMARTCQEHAPADQRDEEVAELGDELEVAVQVEQRVDVL